MPKAAITAQDRRQVFERANHHCEYCKNQQGYSTAALDPLTRKVVLLFNPRIQVWEEHFAWDETLTQIVGLTPTGRATIKCLKMNRAESVNLRMALVAFGKHPPG